MPTTNVKVLGGGNTYVRIGLAPNETGQTASENEASSTGNVEFLAQIVDTPGGPLAQPEQIQPIGSPYPVEIATAYGQQAGTLQLTVWAKWAEDGWVSAFRTKGSGKTKDGIPSIWNAFATQSKNADMGSSDRVPVDLYEILRGQRLNDAPIQIVKVERDAKGNPARMKWYEGCVITNVDAQERVTQQAMSQQVVITVMYRRAHITRAAGVGEQVTL